MNELEWKTEKRIVNDLIPYEKNPRKITDHQKEQLKKSIEKFNFVELPAINQDRTIIAGHQRIKILQLLGRGEEKIEVRVPNRLLTDKELQEYNIRSNRNTGEFDFSILETKFDRQDLMAWGFADNELWQVKEEAQEDNFDTEKAAKEPKYKVKQGEVYLLEQHRLMCGDATKSEEVAILMQDDKADMVLTDPPYGIDLNTDYSNISKNWKGRVPFAESKKYDKIKGDKTKFNFNNFKWLDCKEQFWWGANYYLKQLPVGGSWYIWDKTAGHTQIVVGNEFEMLWSKNKHKQEILTVKWAGVMGLQSQDIKKRVHPTQKPLEVCIPFINKFSNENQIILDIFGGSGTTLIACEQLNRKCLMMELDPVYCSVIIERWEALTQKKAVKVSG